MDARKLTKVISFRIARIATDLGAEPEDNQGPMIILFDDLEKALEFLEQQDSGGDDPFV